MRIVSTDNTRNFNTHSWLHMNWVISRNDGSELNRWISLKGGKSLELAVCVCGQLTTDIWNEQGGDCANRSTRFDIVSATYLTTTTECEREQRFKRQIKRQRVNSEHEQGNTTVGSVQGVTDDDSTAAATFADAQHKG